MKDVSNSLWNARLCLLQGTCAFVVDATTRLFTASLDVSILIVVSDRHSKGSKMLLNFPLTREILVSYFRHCDTRGVKMSMHPSA